MSAAPAPPWTRPNPDRRGFVDALLRGECTQPHDVLGAHRTGTTIAIRAWHPAAAGCAVQVGNARIPMMRLDDRGLFEAEVRGDMPLVYRLAWQFADATVDLEDPYRFLPTLGELDQHLIAEGNHHQLWRRLGAHVMTHDGVAGVAFAVWAPNARGVSIAGDHGYWNDTVHPMRNLGASGIWELFLPGAAVGSRYKFAVTRADGTRILKADPLAQATEAPPANSSAVAATSTFGWTDESWLTARGNTNWTERPVSIYEVHLGSWRRGDGDHILSYREAGALLGTYASEMGFTHVELLPVAEHPFTGSWGYQVTGYYAPTARFGTPDDLRALVDVLHAHGVGVIVDWVPAHFPRDDWALARFDGTALYEHADPRRGEQPDWGTYVFNFGRHEVRNFLTSNARYWIEEFHIDGLRVDAVAAMLYLDYSRNDGDWIPNVHGGRENLEAVSLLREVTESLRADHHGVLTIAEESTAWPGVTARAETGGLGFSMKWNMGWMHDTLEYFRQDPIYRRYHHHRLTFGLWYAYSERFVLPLSHDEVVHGKGSLLNKMPGDRWQKHSNLRCLLAWQWAHPGKQLLFMGGEFAQEREWSAERSLDWHLLDDPLHVGTQRLVRDLNRVYREHPSLWERDASPDGFAWIDAGNADQNVLSFVRRDASGNEGIVCVANLSPMVHTGFRVGLPAGGTWREVINTDFEGYGGSNVGNGGGVWADDHPMHGMSHSAELTLPPLGILWLTPG